MSNHLKNGGSYVAYQATRRRRRAAKFWAEHETLGGDDEVDGKQALIDLTVDSGGRLTQALVDAFEAAGYVVPDAIKPRGSAEQTKAGDARNAPASKAPDSGNPSTDNHTTDPLPCQAADLLDDPRVDGVAFSGPWTNPRTSVGIGGRWNQEADISWHEAEAEARRRGWRFDGYWGYLRPVAGGAA